MTSFLKLFGTFILLLFCCSVNANEPLKYSKKLAPWVDFLEKQNTSGIDYIFELFEKYDLVVICERMHPEYTQYNFIYQIVTDPRFVESEGKIYTEIFSIAGTEMYNRLTFTEDDTAVKKSD